jgi:hypothetical protein
MFCHIQSTMTKEEVERLLKHGAYEIFKEQEAGEAESQSNDFLQQDIDTILQRHSKTVVHENTGSKSNAGGGTFSKASFKAKTPDPNRKSEDDIEIEDPDFWKKMLGDSVPDENDDHMKGPRQRNRANYDEKAYTNIDRLLDEGNVSDNEEKSDTSDDEESLDGERTKWGGALSTQWKKDDAENVVRALSTYGYNVKQWDVFIKKIDLTKQYDPEEVRVFRRFFVFIVCRVLPSYYCRFSVEANVLVGCIAMLD